MIESGVSSDIFLVGLPHGLFGLFRALYISHFSVKRTEFVVNIRVRV